MRKDGVEVKEITQAMPPKDMKLKSEKKPPGSRPRLERARRKIAAWLSAGATIVTLLGIYILKPSIVIEPYASTDPTHPFSQQFFVQNKSIYSIYNVQPICGFPKDSNAQVRALSLMRQDEEMDELEAGAKTTLTCSLGTGPIATAMKITPWVKYAIPLGIQKCYWATFIGKPGTSGNAYVWTYHGSSSSCDLPN
jgi:hypothetical protein